MVVGLLLITLQVKRVHPSPASLTFSVYDQVELERFRRYVKLVVNVDSSVATGSSLALIPQCSYEFLLELVADYKTEFGIDTLAKDAQGLVKIPYPLLTIKLAGQPTIGKFLNGKRKGTWLALAIQDLVRTKKCQVTALIERIEYRMRPIITKDLEIGESVDGTIKIAKNDIREDIRFAFERPKS